MRIRSLTFIAALAVTVIGTAAQAQDTGRPGFALAGSVGTTGIGIDVIFEADKHLDIRLNGSYFTISHSINTNDINFHGTLNPEAYAVLLDAYPFNFGLRVTGGLMVNHNTLSLSATPTTAQKIGNATYQPDEIGRIDGGVRYRDMAPYLGIGYTSGRDRRGWGFLTDLGVMFSGPPQILLQAHGPISNRADLVSDLETERLKVQDKVNFLKYYPVIKFGAVYHF